jgi:diacylglycerol kinase family enzyme
MQSQKSALLPVPVPTVEVIVNHKSGLGNQLDFELLKSNFERFHLNAHISAARNGEEVKELARRARKGDSKVVVAAGGDGTVSAVASELAGTDKVLAILPRGTLNHFAKDLNLPLDLESAVRTIAAGHNKRVDIGEINGHTFINNSSLGLYPSIVSERQKKQRLGFRKWPAFLWAAFTVLRRYPFLDVKLTIDGAEFRSRTPFVFVGNNEYQMESFQIGGRTCLDAGELSLYITHRKGRLGLLRLVLLALLGRLRTEKDFIALCTEEIWIDTHRRVLRVALDGEVQTMTPPLHYRVRPLALRVIVPNDQS